jgi:aldehyde dehydrogenase (NAD+)
MTVDLKGIYAGKHTIECNGSTLISNSPIDDSEVCRTQAATPDDVNRVVFYSNSAFASWRTVPAPIRGEFVRQLGNVLRERKEHLANVITIEVGKIKSEALGEVQEMIDICDFAVGISRQLHGLTIASERPQHRLMEQWHPIGPIGVISAFNFPMAVWAWNATLAFVCGNSVIWKPSEKAMMCAKVCQEAVVEAISRCDFEVPDYLSIVVNGEADVGEELARCDMVPVISATGSTRMGKIVGGIVGQRLGRSILERRK